jgi:hypothetical protein
MLLSCTLDIQIRQRQESVTQNKPAIVNAPDTSCLKCAYRIPVTAVKATAIRTTTAIREACHRSMNRIPLSCEAANAFMKNR